MLTQREVELLGHGFSRLWPVDETPCFQSLVNAIDEADRQLKNKNEQKLAQPVAGGGRR